MSCSWQINRLHSDSGDQYGTVFTSNFFLKSNIYNIFSLLYCCSHLNKKKQGSPVLKIRPENIDRIIRKLKPKRSLGLDGIPAYVHRGCWTLLVAPLTHNCNLNIRSGRYSLRYTFTKMTVALHFGSGTTVRRELFAGLRIFHKSQRLNRESVRNFSKTQSLYRGGELDRSACV